MGPDYVELGYGELALAAALIVINGAVSVALRLGLERRLAVAAARTVAQLLLVGLVLEKVFAWRSAPAVVGLGVLMTAVATVAAVRRSGHRYPSIWLHGAVGMWASSWLVTAVALGPILAVDPWFRPQYAVPLLGMILGNTLTGISLGMDRLGKELVEGRERVELLLTLGATRWEAARAPVRQAAITGMVPILNTMSVVGLVSLPGMMTGQLLAGAPPLQAVRYQIVILFLIAAATALGTVVVVLLGYRRLFNDRHQFLARAIESRR